MQGRKKRLRGGPPKSLIRPGKKVSGKAIEVEIELPIKVVPPGASSAHENRSRSQRVCFRTEAKLFILDGIILPPVPVPVPGTHPLLYG